MRPPTRGCRSPFDQHAQRPRGAGQIRVVPCPWMPITFDQYGPILHGTGQTLYMRPPASGCRSLLTTFCCTQRPAADGAAGSPGWSTDPPCYGRILHGTGQILSEAACSCIQIPCDRRARPKLRMTKKTCDTGQTMRSTGQTLR